MQSDNCEQENIVKTRNVFNNSEIESFAVSGKVGIVATVNSEGKPHLSLLTSIQAKDEKHLTIGEFCIGESKRNMQNDPKVSWLIMSLDRKYWRGKALWTHLKKEGEDYEIYNMQPMFRYNSYFGINTVHYLDLIETSESAPLPLPKIIASSLLTRLGNILKAGNPPQAEVMNHFTRAMFDKLDNLKFAAYVAEDGYPRIIPLMQMISKGTDRLSFSTLAFGDELKEIPQGADIALYAMTMQMETVLVRGIFKGYSRSRVIEIGNIDIDYAYNSMPPGHGQIYPPKPIEAIEDFK